MGCILLVPEATRPLSGTPSCHHWCCGARSQGEGRPGSGYGPTGKGQEVKARLGTEEWEWNGGQRVRGSRVVLWGQWPTWGRSRGQAVTLGDDGGSQQVPVGHGLNEEGLSLLTARRASLVAYTANTSLPSTRMERMPPYPGPRAARDRGRLGPRAQPRPEPGGGEGSGGAPSRALTNAVPRYCSEGGRGDGGQADPSRRR